MLHIGNTDRDTTLVEVRRKGLSPLCWLFFEVLLWTILSVLLCIVWQQALALLRLLLCQCFVGSNFWIQTVIFLYIYCMNLSKYAITHLLTFWSLLHRWRSIRKTSHDDIFLMNILLSLMKLQWHVETTFNMPYLENTTKQSWPKAPIGHLWHCTFFAIKTKDALLCLGLI